MEQYQLNGEHKKLIEQLKQPVAVFQLVAQKFAPLAVSDGFCKLFGYRERADAYRDLDFDLFGRVHPEDAVRVASAAVQFASDGQRYEVIYRAKARQGEQYRVIHAFGELVNAEDGVLLAHAWYADEGVYAEGDAADGSGMTQALYNALHEQNILKASQYDFLTGLPSMTYFFELAETEKLNMQKNGADSALMYMDFSGMKFFNTKHGFAEGDKMLQSFARILGHMFGSKRCCHIGADHFAVITEEEGLESKLEKLFEAYSDLSAGRFPPIHVGIYPGRLESVHVSVACDRAKLACTALKGAYASGFNYYDHDLDDDAIHKQYIIENLDAAIGNHWIQVYYQPIIRAVNEKVCDEEALARWIDPEKGFLSPAAFIPSLEEAGLLYKLDLYVLEQVLEKMNLFKEKGIPVVPHSVNLSRSDFDACDIVEEIRQRVDKAGISRSLITIEITESVIGSDFEFIHQQVQRFQALGFPVWMDDFGSGYSSLDVLQSIRFDLIKFDMSFMKKLDEGDAGKIILTELMKMATALGVDTVCEGVETKEQARFLQDIGCAKLQGYYFCKPVPPSYILDKAKTGYTIGYENQEESAYFESIGRVNLFDLSMVGIEDENAFQNAFDTLPMGVIEIKGGEARFVRSNQSYRDFMKRFFGLDLSREGGQFKAFSSSFMENMAKTCCASGGRMFYDEKTRDGYTVRSFARRVGVDPVTGCIAVAVAVLSVNEPYEGATYADIAGALAADYYNIYVIDLDTEDFIEYTSRVGGDELAVERRGEGFFASARRDTMTRIYEEDRASFLALFTKENVVHALDVQGVFTTSYRLIDTGDPMYVNMKITRMQQGGNRLIMGISIIDSQMKQQQQMEEAWKERDMLARVMSLSDGYLSLYSVDPETGHYMEYVSTDEYETLGFAKEGDDFFLRGIEDGKRTVYEEDLPYYLENFSKELVLESIHETGDYRLHYRLMILGRPMRVSLRIKPFKEGNKTKLFAGVRAWKERKQGS